ncbi:TIGR02450 family Trp-rich protein [Pseudomonas brassicacearum]|uniref:TIGR02450 family Trp-rich protein n=1 Tax=Pseudomonas brassicacearum TaxID=930166 RepID=UPI001E4D35D0|nr:TIGR02450 family Trp-rich protein [Pseudomonas brassicacearum]
MNKFNPRKLRLSKWTACNPVNREKHFLVLQLLCDEQGSPIQVELQAVQSARIEWLDWQVLRDSTRWKMGWS